MPAKSQPPFAAIDTYCLAKPGSLVDYPFDETTRVYKVLGKMFALISESDDPLRLNLKCDPADAQALRAEHPRILPGYHMNKQHWNTLVLDGSLPDELVYELIDHSYDLVVARLTRAQKKELGL